MIFSFPETTKQTLILAKIFNIPLVFLIVFTALSVHGFGQQITGVWQGKIDNKKVEVKIILRGDSLTGSSYYYESPNHYRRYSIKGHFDEQTNEAVWWDDQLIEEKNGKGLSIPGKIPMLSRADFNCPDGRTLKLDGQTASKENGKTKGEVHLDKSGSVNFADEWDDVIDNYLVGGNDPEYIASVENSIHHNRNSPQPVIESVTEKTVEPPVREPAPSKDMVFIPQIPVKEEKQVIIPVKQPTLEEKFIARKKKLAIEIPISGDSIELRFYDNAEIDGDSISLFLNNNLLFSHIRLLGSAYIIKLAVNELQSTNELIMVAENLGSIPPNTSYMVAIVDDKRYEARLESTEGSSAMIRFVKEDMKKVK